MPTYERHFERFFLHVQPMNGRNGSRTVCILLLFDWAQPRPEHGKLALSFGAKILKRNIGRVWKEPKLWMLWFRGLERSIFLRRRYDSLPHRDWLAVISTQVCSIQLQQRWLLLYKTLYHTNHHVLLFGYLVEIGVQEFPLRGLFSRAINKHHLFVYRKHCHALSLGTKPVPNTGNATQHRALGMTNSTFYCALSKWSVISPVQLFCQG